MPVTLSTKVSKAKGMSLKDLESALLSISADLAPQIKSLGRSTYVFIDGYIESKRKRKRPPAKPKLSSAFKDTEVVLGGNMEFVSIGLGNAVELQSKFPYWLILNYGGLTPKTVGWFGYKQPPMAGKSGDIFYHHRSVPTGSQYQAGDEGAGSYLLEPKVAITGIHYLEEANNWLKLNWNQVWDAYIKGKMYRVPTPTFDGGKLVTEV